MTSSEPTQIAPPLSPPQIPAGLRARRLALRAIPAVVWAAAVLCSLWLYRAEANEGQMLAYSEVVEVDVTPPVDGKLAAAELEIGQQVRAGAVIATLDAREVNERIVYAKTEVERARARADAQKKLVAALPGKAVSAQAASLCDADPQRLRLELDRLTADQASDRGERETLFAEIQRLRTLADKQLVTEERLHELVLRQTVLDSRMSARATQLAAHESCFGATADAELRTLELRLAELERERSKHDIVAPVSGTISEVTHRTGEWVSAGTSLAKIVNPRELHITAYISGRQVPLISIGEHVTLTPRERGGAQLHGAVAALGPRFEKVPLRLQFIPTIPQWGRIATIQVEPPGALIAGELYNVSFDER